MKRTLFILMLGLACGAGAHFGWYAWQRPHPAKNLDAELAWMQDSLGLTRQQIASLRTLHEQSAPRLLQLAGEVARMKAEFAAFEHERRAVGRIDFLDFARFIADRRRLARECADSTRQLVDATAHLMTPKQREQYFLLLGSARKTYGAGSVD